MCWFKFFGTEGKSGSRTEAHRKPQSRSIPSNTVPRVTYTIHTTEKTKSHPKAKIVTETEKTSKGKEVVCHRSSRKSGGLILSERATDTSLLHTTQGREERASKNREGSKKRREKGLTQTAVAKHHSNYSKNIKAENVINLKNVNVYVQAGHENNIQDQTSSKSKSKKERNEKAREKEMYQVTYRHSNTGGQHYIVPSPPALAVMWNPNASIPTVVDADASSLLNEFRASNAAVYPQYHDIQGVNVVNATPTPTYSYEVTPQGTTHLGMYAGRPLVSTNTNTQNVPQVYEATPQLRHSQGSFQYRDEYYTAPASPHTSTHNAVTYPAQMTIEPPARRDSNRLADRRGPRRSREFHHHYQHHRHHTEQQHVEVDDRNLSHRHSETRRVGRELLRGNGQTERIRYGGEREFVPSTPHNRDSCPPAPEPQSAPYSPEPPEHQYTRRAGVVDPMQYLVEYNYDEEGHSDHGSSYSSRSSDSGSTSQDSGSSRGTDSIGTSTRASVASNHRRDSRASRMGSSGVFGNLPRFVNVSDLRAPPGGHLGEG